MANKLLWPTNRSRRKKQKHGNLSQKSFFVGKPFNKHKVILPSVWPNSNNLSPIEFKGHQPKIGSPSAVTSSEEVNSSRFRVSSPSCHPEECIGAYLFSWKDVF
jgi:hypothetical protein